MRGSLSSAQKHDHQDVVRSRQGTRHRDTDPKCIQLFLHSTHYVESWNEAQHTSHRSSHANLVVKIADAVRDLGTNIETKFGPG